MPSNNVFSADNQQERLRIIGWIVGFVDGEGCFSVSINKNRTTKSGYQIFPEFVITQGEKSLSALKEVQNYFGCGKIYINHRYDNHREPIYRYCVRLMRDLNHRIIPFFRRNPLHTSKVNDFKKFAEIIEIMNKAEHLTSKGRNKIIKLISGMNRKKPRSLKSSETIRQSPT